MGLKKATAATPTATMKNPRRKSSSHTNRRLSRPGEGGGRIAARIDGGASVSDKLAALKSLVPSDNSADINPDQLFQKTADYIVLLKTQVLVLQKLIDFCGSQQSLENNPNSV